ncbi:MAG: response regulator transcription factor [Armatimonadetes bacterium]|nr:response regulator transcription factor [Armatimonadota bacterium]
METILVVEDEEPVRELVSVYLRREGFRVETAEDGEKALAMVRSFVPDLILLDLMLPRLDGWTVCREIRKTLTVPIIMLTAKGEESDRILGLELGADDYITKPFSPREMVARVKAVLRRLKYAGGPNDVLHFPGLSIDRNACRVEAGGKEIQLTPKEFDLLWFLASHPQRVYSREQILEQVWGYECPVDSRTVDAHIKKLREKLKSPGSKNCIVTVWGKGYRFEVTE